MNIDKILADMTPEKLEAGLSKLSGILSESQMRQVKQVLQSTDKTELSEKLKNVDMNELKNQPEFKKIFPNK